MKPSYLEIPEAANRTIEKLQIHDDPPYGREVLIVFTDGTQLSIDLEIKTKVRTKHYTSDITGDLKVLHRHEEPRANNISTNPQ